MSCFCADLQALQLLFPNFVSGIARALPSFLLYIFKFPDSRCRPLMSLSDNLNPFPRCQGGKHKLCTYGAEMTKSTVNGLTPRHTQRPPTYPDPFFPRPCQNVTEKPTQYSLLQHLPRKTFEGYNYCSYMLFTRLEVRIGRNCDRRHSFSQYGPTLAGE